MKVNLEKNIENSPVIVTLLTPKIGYLKSADLFKESLKTGKTIRELVVSKKLMTNKEVSSLLELSMAKIWVEAYGCSASYSDSEMISGLIVNGGHTLAENSKDSDLNVIVTCSVKDATADKMIRRIMDSSSKPLVVAGCLPKAEKNKVEKFAENASLLGPNSIGKTLQVIQSTLERKENYCIRRFRYFKGRITKNSSKSSSRNC